MPVIPTDRSYTTEHEWLIRAGDLVTVGITSYAAGLLGDIVFVELPTVGDHVEAGRACGELESSKSVSDLYSPADGDIAEVNEAVLADPSLINSDPYQAGWLFTVHIAGTPTGLLDAEAYAGYTNQTGGNGRD